MKLIHIALVALSLSLVSCAHHSGHESCNGSECKSEKKCKDKTECKRDKKMTEKEAE